MTTSSFAGFVLNNESGHSLINAVRKNIKGKNVVVRLFARNSNRKQYAKNRVQRMRYRQHLPVKFATHYGVYIYNDHKKATRCTATDIAYTKGVFDTLLKVYKNGGEKVTP